MPRLYAALCLILAARPVSLAADEPVRKAGVVRTDAGGRRTYFYAPKRRLPEALEPILKHVAPGADEFPEEKDAFEIGARLDAFGAALRAQGPAGAAAALETLLAPDFKGGGLVPAAVASKGRGTLEIARSVSLPSGLARDRRAFGAELGALLAEVDTLQTTEFLLTAIERGTTAAAPVRTVVRYDFVGSGKEAWRAERIGRWALSWRRGADGAWQVTEWTALDDLRSRATAPLFTETTGTALAGNEALKAQLASGDDAWLATLDSAFLIDSMGLNGVAAGDVDGDGLDDLYVMQPSGLPNRLFRNRGDGTFEDWTERSGLDVLDGTSQALIVDVDNDGDEDVVLIAPPGPLLFNNDGKGRFVRDPLAFRLAGPLRGSAVSASMADFDRDGFLDLYLCTYLYFIGASADKAGPPAPYHDARNGPPDVLFRNDGHGRFVDVTREAGIDNNERFSFAAAWGDYDGDGWIDLLVANDFGGKNLYRNLGGAPGAVRFKDVAAEAGVLDHGAGMSATWLDYDHDGRLDIYTGNMWSATGLRVTARAAYQSGAPEATRALYRRHARGNSLFRNRGDGTFEDVSLAARAEMGRWAWSSDVVDFDRDGWEDLFIVNGMFTRGDDAPNLDSFFWRQVTARSPLERRTGTPYDDAWRSINRLLAVDGAEAPHERNVFLRNDGHGGFDEVSGSLGLDLDQDGRSFAVLDYDGDGDSDLAVFTPRSTPQIRLFRNDHPERGAAVAVRLRGARSNRDAVGARVTVETAGGRVTRLVQAGSGFISQHSKELLFGLGDSDRVSKLTVQWPSGQEQVLTDVPIDRRLYIEEGSAAPRVEPFRTPAVGSASPAPAAAPLPSATWMYQPYPAPDFTLADLDGKKRALSALRGRPVLLLFWATWAPPSLSALQDLAKQQAAAARAGVELMTLSLDAPEDEGQVRAAAAGLGLPTALAGEDVGGTYTFLNQYLFVRKEPLRVPTLLLVNAAGDIVKAYRDPFAAADAVADVARIAAPSAERLARAVPFKGTFQVMPAERMYLQYALDLVEQGFEASALPAFERAAKQEPNAIAFYSLGTLYTKKGDTVRARAAYERALELKADFAEANNSLGALVAQGGDVAGAVARFRAALEAKPEYPDALNNLGYALFQMKQPAKAYDLYQKALALQPEFPQAFNNLGIYHAQQGDMVKARDYFRRAVSAQPDYGEAAVNLALVHMALSDPPGAVRTLQGLLAANPGFEMAYITLAKIYLSTGRGREGMQVLEQLLQRNPSHPMALEMVRQLKAGAR